MYRSIYELQAVLKSWGNAGTRRPPTFFRGGTTYLHFSGSTLMKPQRNRFRDYIDNNGQNVSEELKQVFTCVDSLPVSTADC